MATTTDTKDAGIAAVKRITALLEKLSEADRARVLSALRALYPVAL